MKNRFYFFFKFSFAFLILLLFAQKNNSEAGSTSPHFPENKIAGVLIINVQPYKGIPDNYINYVFMELKKVYPNIELKDPIPVSAQAYYKPRNRYRADSLIKILGRRTPLGQVTVGITTKDISDTKDQYPDWGVMGLGFCPGNACVVSTHRLDKKNLLDQLFKVVIHELGHTQGLPHCDVKYCFMRDAEGKNSTDEETAFCPRCKAVLVSKGWKFQ